MGLRFRKSIKVAPGVKLNLNKKSAGVTLGTKGAHYTINSSGKRTASVGLPGTGLSYSTTSGGGKKGTKNAKRPQSKKAGFQKYIGIIIAIVAIVCTAGAVKSSFDKKAASTPAVKQEATASAAAVSQETPAAADAAVNAADSSAANAAADSVADTTVKAQDTVPAGDTAAKVWISDSGTKYHTKSDCSGMENAREVTLQEALDMGRTACKRCD